MATRRKQADKTAASLPSMEVNGADAVPESIGEEEAAPEMAEGRMEDQPLSSEDQAASCPGFADKEPESACPSPEEPEMEPEKPISLARFHFFIIDSGWKSVSAKVIRDNFKMIREFQSHDPLYVLSQEQSIALIRANPDWIGKDPIILVHDLHAKGGEGVSGYCGFRLCLGLIKNSEQALTAMQEFLRFVHNHRRSHNIEKEIQAKLHREGIEGAIEVLRTGAQELAAG